MDENFNKREQEVEDQPDVYHLDVGIIKVLNRSKQRSPFYALVREGWRNQIGCIFRKLLNGL